MGRPIPMVGFHTARRYAQAVVLHAGIILGLFPPPACEFTVLPSQLFRADTQNHESEDLTPLSLCLVARRRPCARNPKPQLPILVIRKPETYHNSEAETCNLQPTHPGQSD